MNRKYNREWYLERVDAIKRIIPDCGLTTDIFSGFHSETEEDHQESLSLMEICGYDAAFMFKYSERPGTYASKHLEDNVPEEVKIRRLNEIIAFAKPFVGRIECTLHREDLRGVGRGRFQTFARAALWAYGAESCGGVRPRDA